METLRDRVESARLQWTEASQGEERHIRDTLLCQMIDQVIVLAVREVIKVLYADDLCNLHPLGDLRGGDVAQANVPNEASAF